MRLSSDISRGITPGRVQDKLSKRYELEAKYLSDNAQSDPIKILHGRDCLSMSPLTPIFGLRTQEADGGGKGSSKMGGSGQVTYYGGFAGSFCVGPVDAIHSIFESDTELETYEDSGFLLGAEGHEWNESYNEITLGDYGVLRIHSGTATQTVDPRFAQGQPPIIVDLENPDESTIPTGETFQTGYRHICYVVTDDFKLGSSNTTPNLRLELSCTPKCFQADYPDFFTGEGALSVSDANGDVFPPLIVYEYLRNATWGGAGLDAADIDHESFREATAQCIRDGIAITALQDANKTTIRDAISQILQYCDGVLCLSEDSKISIKLVRAPESLAGIPTITDAILAEEPQVNWAGVDGIWGRTEIVFNSRADSYESTAEVYESPRYSGSSLKTIRTESFNLPFCKNRLLAANLARRFGSAGATPSCEITFSIIKDFSPALGIGNLVLLTYSKFGIDNLLLRVNKITRGNPLSPAIQITAVSQPLSAWNVEVANLSNGYKKAQDSDNQTPGGFFKPRLLLLSDSGNGTQIAAFAERNTEAAIINYEVTGGSDYEDDFTWAKKGDNKYQTQIEIVNLSQYGNKLLLEIKIEGQKRIREFDKLRADFSSQSVYITCAAYRGGTLTLRPMSFRVISVKNESASGDYSLYVSSAQILPNWVYPTSGETGYKPSQIGYIHRHKSDLSELFTFATEDFKILFNQVNSQTRFVGDFGGGVLEISPCNFIQTYENSVYSHFLRVAGEETQYPAWGPAVAIDPNISISSQTSTPVIPAGGEELSYFWLNPITGENKVYTENGWELVDNSNVLAPLIPPEQIPFGSASDEVARGDHLHDERYQLIGDSAERYYRSFTSSSSLNHVRGSDGRVHVHLIDEMPITITLPSIAQAENGDMITVFLSTLDGVEQEVITVAADADEVFANGQNEVIMGTGTILQLVCVEDGWLPILKSILE